MSDNQTFSRSLHDLGLAAWFGGSLMGAIGLNGGAATAEVPSERARIASAGWDAWTPVNAAAIGAHLIGSVGMLAGDKSRLASQKGAGALAFVKTVVTVGALAATGAARWAGQKIDDQSSNPVAGVTEPSAATPEELAKAQNAEKMLQWAIPALTGLLVIITAAAGEQQRTTSVAEGTLKRVKDFVS